MTVPAPPGYVAEILSRLVSGGHEAYPVGGCVRDSLLGRRPGDWDLCTSARPDQVLELFPRSLTTGMKHGTIAVRCGKKLVEVTTFRTDGAYSDRRSPDSVCFTSDLLADLTRRDFTMNAIAATSEGALIDPFGGEADIRLGVIRCVGDADRRFSEDALRMFRALRFSAQLGFGVAPDTLGAIYENAALARFLSAERVRDELLKILLSPRPELAETVINSGLLAAFVAPGAAPELSRLKELPKKMPLRLAGLCALLSRAGGLTDTSAFLGALRIDSACIRACSAGVLAALSVAPSCSREWKALLSATGRDAAECAAAADTVLRGGRPLRALGAVLRSGECFSLDTLDLRGEDLLSLGLSGREVGAALRRALEHVIAEPADNRKHVLLRILSESTE